MSMFVSSSDFETVDEGKTKVPRGQTELMLDCTPNPHPPSSTAVGIHNCFRIFSNLREIFVPALEMYTEVGFR